MTDATFAITGPHLGSSVRPCDCCGRSPCQCTDPTHRVCVFAWFGSTNPASTGTRAAAPATAEPRGPCRSLICPECGGGARHTPPHQWSAKWGPRPCYAHTDGSPLCPVPVGYVPAAPIPTGQARATRVATPPGPAWPGSTAGAARALTAAVHRLAATTTPGGAPDAYAVTATLVAAVHEVTDCCQRLEAVIAAASDRAGRRMVQATGTAEHLVIRLTDVCTTLDQR